MQPVVPGNLVAERYRLIREIGLGGMGSVWLAYDEALASRCAVKLLHPEPERQEELALRLECEAKCAAQLRSPHVVDVLNRGTWQGKPFIVMEYMEGEDLAERLERVHSLDATTTYRIVAQVARALTRAHGLGIIHRDIKPANVFLIPGEEHEVAKVLDFGIAKHRALPNAFENPQEASFIGTPCYMSPEQARGEGVDFRSDLWALAVITYECLTGSLPFADESVVTVLQAVTQGNLPSIVTARPDLPEALEAWWRRATAYNPAYRYQSAKEFADALGEALDFPKMPISRPAREGATATTLLVPGELPPSARALSRRAPAHETSHNTSITLHAARARSSSERVRIPMQSRRGLAFAAAAAVCAAIGLGASSLRAELDWAELPGVAAVAAGITRADTSKSTAATAMPVANARTSAVQQAPAEPLAPLPAVAPAPAVVTIARLEPAAKAPVAMLRAHAEMDVPPPTLKVTIHTAQPQFESEALAATRHLEALDPPEAHAVAPTRAALSRVRTSLDDVDHAAPAHGEAQPATTDDDSERVMPAGQKDYGI